MTFNKQVFKAILFPIGLWLVLEFVSYIVAEVLWFEEVGYLSVFWRRVVTEWVLFAFTLAVTFGFWLGNLALANRLKFPSNQDRERDSKSKNLTRNFTNTSLLRNRKKSKTQIELIGLILFAFGLSLLISYAILYYGKIAVRFWNIDISLANTLLPLPIEFRIDSIGQMAKDLLFDWWQLGVLITFTIILTIAPQFWLNAVAILMSLGLALISSHHWAKVLQYLQPTAFKITEPLFNLDLSFYVFTLPILQLIAFLATGLFFYGLLSCTLLYLLSGNSLSQGTFHGFSPQQQRHLYGLGGGVMLVIAFRYWLARYELLYSQQSVTYGASYTDVTVQLPTYTILSILAGITSIFLFFQAIKFKHKNKILKPIILGFVIANVALTLVLPEVVQRLGVQPNELARERLYIKRSIDFTQQAFDLKRLEVKTFVPESKLTYAELQKNQLTIRNIRLWDKRPLLQTNRQLQQIRPYYKFSDADIDRYTIKKNQKENGDTERQQVIIAARELNYETVPQQAQTWLNENLVYTHGYGFTLSPVNTVGEGGLPNYFVKDIGVNTTSGNKSTLGITSEEIRASIPIDTPRIYYGEITDTDVIAPTKVKEFDYPSGDENVYNNYDGSGGIPIASMWRRLVFAKYLNNWQMALTDNFTPKTKVLFRRNIKERVRAIAPFLRYDIDPYLVVANTTIYNQNKEEEKSDISNSNNYLYWIIDAYTVSDRYPYSDPGQHQFNYIRNSVKVVIDAYNGSVKFYVANPSDPIINSWIAIFPGLFKTLDQMPATLRSHIRYPVDLFSIQSERLLTYHMEDPQVFYNREDLWRVPNEIYGSEQQPVQPYYLIMKLPTENSEEFVLLLPFTPVSRNNLIAWLAARSDGDNYGKLLLYQFPKQRLVYGPEQIEALINQEPAISEQISLWNRQGSKAVQGNLLVIPIEESLLYVEPIYLEATENSLPTLVRVIVAYENRIVMAETLDEALKAVFFSKPISKPAIVRPVKETSPALQ
ncbi:UPF0182 family protein [Kamptonema sp. UHCC 0994]|uniref:UPF0182 family protein n=1 Tax=Kamptonema sp. UHCC 0994 TaxID=3031329 RepID=UPI0023B97639|nr:UPF0182 family protein [Kamptonema sp. UHCC 0994]MDF0555233.1 UPF0182 family protein [Kamptonema sp. UHCC 0994]